jgi:hypothetical protein
VSARRGRENRADHDDTLHDQVRVPTVIVSIPLIGSMLIGAEEKVTPAKRTCQSVPPSQQIEIASQHDVMSLMFQQQVAGSGPGTAVEIEQDSTPESVTVPVK